MPDALFEPDESVSVALVSSTFGTVDTTPVTAVILNDDAPPPVFTLQLAENVTTEGTGAGNGGTAAFLIRRSLVTDLSAATVTVAVAAAGTNPASADDLVDGFAVRQIEFPAGADFLTFSLPFVPDALFEPDESVSVALVSSTFGTVDTTPVTAVILNDDLPPPVFAITSTGPRSVAEGTAADTGGVFTFTVSRVSGDLGAAQVFFSTQGGPAPSAVLDDLVEGMGNLFWVDFAQGQLTGTGSVLIAPDSTLETDESVRITLDGSTYGTTDTTPYDFTIVNDDLAPADLSLSLVVNAEEVVAGGTADVVVRVDNAGPTSAGGTVRLTPGLGVSFLGTSEGFDPATGLWTFGPIAAGGFVEIAIETIFATVGTPDVVAEIITASVLDPDSTPGNGTTNGEDDSAAASVPVTSVAPFAEDLVLAVFEDDRTCTSRWRV
ncbi:MAG: hypothetical protein IPK20_22630 [Betaproteobacteria bacterium]|nr:hypothetical protein [Betaproteobacteria bacterium]